jgi:hypothetical protein
MRRRLNPSSHSFSPPLKGSQCELFGHPWHSCADFPDAFQASPTSYVDWSQSIIQEHPDMQTTDLASPNYEPNLTTIARVISSVATHFTLPISRLLDNYYQSRGPTRITGLRASSVNLFNGQSNPWPVVEWIEGADTDVTAIFKTDHRALCSYILHFGVGSRWEAEGRHWELSSLTWVVPEVDHLRELFTAAQRILGLVSLSDTDVANLYSGYTATQFNDE